MFSLRRLIKWALELLHPSLSSEKQHLPLAVEVITEGRQHLIQRTKKVDIFCKQYVGQRIPELYALIVTDDYRLPVQQRGMFMAICTYAYTQSRVSTRPGAWVNPDICLQSASQGRRACRETNKRGKHNNGRAHLMWSVCKQIAIFYVNLNLSCRASYQACWQRGAYLSCWQDEWGDREEEKEKTCQHWLITSQANSWVLCLHLDSWERLRWASLIRPSSSSLFSHAHVSNTHAHALLGL